MLGFLPKYNRTRVRVNKDVLPVAEGIIKSSAAMVIWL